MKRELQRELMHKAIAHIAAGTTDMAEGVYRQPAANYVDPNRAADEQRLFFQSASAPILIALSCTMPSPGDYIADDMSGVPLIAVRGSDGVARVFRNAYRMETCLFEAFGAHLRELFPRSTIISEKVTVDDEPDALRHNSIIYVLFPNTVIINQVDHLEIWRIFPKDGSAGDTVMQLNFLIPEPITTAKARSHWERSMDLTVRTVLEEDFATAQGIHANYVNGSVPHATIGMCEPALSHFERTVNTELELRRSSAGMRMAAMAPHR